MSDRVQRLRDLRWRLDMGEYDEIAIAAARDAIEEYADLLERNPEQQSSAPCAACAKMKAEIAAMMRLIVQAAGTDSNPLDVLVTMRHRLDAMDAAQRAQRQGDAASVAQDLARSAYQDGYGAQPTEGDYSERTLELIKRLSGNQG